MAGFGARPTGKVAPMKLRNFLPKQWGAMSLYQRFESLAAMAMTPLVSLVIVVAIVRLAAVIGSGLMLGAVNPLDYAVFQGVFGEIITVLIALEFNHSLQYVVTAQKSLVQTKAILPIALLAVARKFVILDTQETSGATMPGPRRHGARAGDRLLAVARA
jgi:uncharacterized membrane protein (DUF373 family)